MSQILDRRIAPGIHSFGHLALPRPSLITLENGIPLSILDSGEMDVNRLTISINGGEAEEPVPSLAKLTASLPVEGCDGLSGDKIAEMLEFNGAWVKALAHTHQRSLTIYSLNSTAKKVIPLIGRVLSAPTFPQNEVDNIVGQTAERLRVEQEKVSNQASRAMHRILYGESCPLARESSPEKVASITREDIYSFYYTGFNPSRINAYLSGKITPDILAHVKETLLSLPILGPGYDETPLTFTPSAQHRVHVENPEAVQSAVKLSIPSIGRNHPDYVPLRIAVIALGGYFGSRLMLNIREEKGLTYGIMAALVGYQESSFISISTQTDNRYVETVIAEVIAEIEHMKDPSSYTAEEINRLSRHILSGLASSLDTPFTAMDIWELQLFAKTRPDYFDQQQQVARSLSGELLADIARRYFDTSNLYIATAGKNIGIK